MKTIQLAILHALVALALLSFSGCKHDEEKKEEKVATEVAVQVGKVTKADLRAHVEAFGTAEPEPAKAGQTGGGAKLAAPAAGVVLAVAVTEGQSVKAGDVIVRLDDRMAKAAADKARHAVAFAEQLVARQEKLKAVEGTSEKAIQEAQQQLASAKAELASAQAALAQVQLASPLDGVVARVNVSPGQTVDPATIVAEVVDLSRLVVTANVPAAEATALKTGQSVELFADNAGKPSAAGSVSFVSPSVDPKTGASLVRIALPKDSGLRPGQFVRARIVSEERAGRLTVPHEAVFTDTEGQSTLSVVEGDKAIQKTVKIGLRDGDLLEVEGEGIAEGTTVVTVGSYALPKETKVRIITPGKGEAK